MTTPTGPDATVVVYDLDGVITRFDTFTTFTAGQLCRRPLRLIPTVPLTVRRILSGDAEFRRITGVRIAHTALRGVTDTTFSDAVGAFGRRVGGSRAWIRRSTVERIRRQKAQGATVVIATATERRLATALLETAGIPYDLLSASEFTVTPTGMEVSDHRLGQRKAGALLQLGVDLAHAEFVTDAVTDLPTARAAGSVVLIGASSRTRQQFLDAGIQPLPER